MIDPAALADFGPFFAVTTHRHAPDRPWQPMSGLVTDPAQLAARVTQVGDALHAAGAAEPIERRVAASVAQLGLVARLAAPALALAVLGAPDPLADLTAVYWQPELGGPFPLSLPRFPDGYTQHRSSLTPFLEGPALALVEATRRVVPIAAHALWGNVASAVYTAAQLIGSVQADVADRAATIAGSALDHLLLRAEHQRRAGRFQRRSCCLIYRIAGSVPISARGLCGDCALAR